MRDESRKWVKKRAEEKALMMVGEEKQRVPYLVALNSTIWEVPGDGPLMVWAPRTRPFGCSYHSAINTTTTAAVITAATVPSCEGARLPSEQRAGKAAFRGPLTWQPWDQLEGPEDAERAKHPQIHSLAKTVRCYYCHTAVVGREIQPNTITGLTQPEVAITSAPHTHTFPTLV